MAAARSGSKEIAALGEAVRTTRTERGWEQLARESGLSVGIVSQIERGQGNPALSTCSAPAARMRSTRAQVVPPMEPLGDDHSAACIRVHELARAPG